MNDDEQPEHDDEVYPCDTKAPRAGEMRHVNAVIGDVELPEKFAGWTDADWAAHDAQVQRDIAARVRIEQQAERVAIAADLKELGWPDKKLADALVADREHMLIVGLLAHDFARMPLAFVSGIQGCGKTVAAASWALERAPRARFIRAASFARGSRYDAAERLKWYAAPALILDDLGAEYLDSAGSFRVDMDELIDTFYADGRKLVITTNLQVNQIEDRYGPRIRDRIRESADWISCDGPSLRKRPT